MKAQNGQPKEQQQGKKEKTKETSLHS
ncbi:uncharacterized protein G2W53_020697 [Senna tora]|uniref:Uncharacterized protein n=1 Tax=Senna tora TaxID=362788 RepID=A0A834THZ0_9FABA|nr:uncharacterized protein G2W53_020697 [Senna tora]